MPKLPPVPIKLPKMANRTQRNRQRVATFWRNVLGRWRRPASRRLSPCHSCAVGSSTRRDLRPTRSWLFTWRRCTWLVASKPSSTRSATRRPPLVARSWTSCTHFVPGRIPSTGSKRGTWKCRWTWTSWSTPTCESSAGSWTFTASTSRTKSNQTLRAFAPIRATWPTAHLTATVTPITITGKCRKDVQSLGWFETVWNYRQSSNS